LRNKSSTQPVRQELTGFFDLLFKYNAVIKGTQKELQTINTSFFSRQSDSSPSDFEKALECLDQIDEWSRRFHSSIRQSIQLPLVVIPLRLPLLMAILNVQSQVAKMKQLVTLQREALWRSLYPTVEQWVAIQQGAEKLRQHCDEVLEQMDILMEKLRYEKHRAQFEKRILI
jgi:hypothetical protein